MFPMRSPTHDGPRACNDRSLPVLLSSSSEPVIVESHFAGWSKPWRALDERAWTELQREFGERINCAIVETGACRELAQRYGLEILPEVLVFLRGQVVARFHGQVEIERVAAAVRDACRTERAHDEARQELALDARPAPEPAPSAPPVSILRRRPGAVGVAVLARA